VSERVRYQSMMTEMYGQENGYSRCRNGFDKRIKPCRK